ncbi:MAG: peptide-methionine (S)-S-oxide reductase MsrA [Ginsengibacter sp.]
MKKSMLQLVFFLVAIFVFATSCFTAKNEKANAASLPITVDNNGKKMDTATFAAGCFWCVDAQFRQLRGVENVVSGFAGGDVKNPTYEEVCTGTTGHAEACNIIYDPSQISYDELLEAFFTAHDPTQLNRQGNDVGTQYRSEIFYHNASQKEKAEYYIQKLNQVKAYKNKIVTQVAPYTVFYKAEGYHQDFYNKNPNQQYCHYVIQPEVEKFRKVFKNKLKNP